MKQAEWKRLNNICLARGCRLPAVGKVATRPKCLYHMTHCSKCGRPGEIVGHVVYCPEHHEEHRRKQQEHQAKLRGKNAELPPSLLPSTTASKLQRMSGGSFIRACDSILKGETLLTKTSVDGTPYQARLEEES